MRVVSTNLAEPKTVSWRGKDIVTGIFKNPVTIPIHLQKEHVANDHVIDRKHHGGEFKACYLFSADDYPYWKEKYPNLNWQWGMFGENITIDSFDEKSLRIGAVYKVGTATVQITEPRQPCFKLGIRFGTQKVLKEFIEHGRSGTYVRILEEGKISVGDNFELIEKVENTLTIYQYNMLVNRKSEDRAIIEQAIANPSIREVKREQLKKLL